MTPTPPNYDAMTVEELNAAVAELEREAEAVKADLRVACRVRARKLHEEMCDHWGVTPEQYAQAKEVARETGAMLHQVLNKARAASLRGAREAQSVRAGVASVGAKGKGV